MSDSPEVTRSASSFLHADLIGPVCLFVLTVLAFVPSLPYGLQSWDDYEYILRNPWITNLSLANIQGVFTNFYFSNYHPLTMLSYMIDVWLFGYTPAGFRAVNILLHGLTVVAAWPLFRLAGASSRITFVLLLIFAIHPLRLESVVWVSERKDVLCGLLYVLALLCWVAGTVDGRSGRLLIPMAVLCTVLSFFAKPMAVSLPFVVLLFDILRAPDRIRRRWFVYTGLLLFALVMAWINSKAQVKATSVEVDILTRLAVAVCAPLHYLYSTLSPRSLSPLYPYEYRPSLHLSWLVLGILLNVAALAIVVFCWRRVRMISFGLLSAALIIGPVSGIISFGSAYAADRYSYLPTLLLFMGIAAAAASIQSQRLALGGRIAGLVAAALLAYETGRLMPIWESNETLWLHVIQKYPQSPIAQVNMQHAKLEDTTAIAEPAAAKAPDAETMQNPVLDLGKQEDVRIPDSILDVTRVLESDRLSKLGRNEAAVTLAATISEPGQRAVQSAKLHRDAGNNSAMVAAAVEGIKLSTTSITADQRSQLAQYLAIAEQFELAREALEGVNRPTKFAPLAWGLIARSELEAGRLDNARLAAGNAVAILPSEINAVTTKARLLLSEGNYAEAKRVLNRAIRHSLAPPETRYLALHFLSYIARSEKDGGIAEKLRQRAELLTFPSAGESSSRAEAYNLAGWLAEHAGLPEAALQLYSQAVQSDPKNPDALMNLAILRAMQGRLPVAINLMEAAARLNPTDEIIRANLEKMKAELAKR